LPKKPWFSFFPKEYGFDKKVMRMTFEAQGVYMRLLCHMWEDSENQCSIENDPEMLRGILKLSRKKFEKIFQQLQWNGNKIFDEVDGKLISRRLEKEKLKCEKLSEKRSEAGKTGNEKRWKENRKCDEFATDLQSQNIASQSQNHNKSKTLPLNSSNLDINSTPGRDKSCAKTASDDAEHAPFFLTHKKRKLTGKRLETFNRFWDAFDYKKGKAPAADSWLDIPELTDSLVLKILDAARKEARARDDLLKAKGTPKMGQGWLSERRWEDEGFAGPKARPQKMSDAARQTLINAGLNPDGEDHGPPRLE